MQTHILTLRFDDLLDTFDDSPFKEFAKDKRIIDLSDHFFIHDGLPYLTLVIQYKLTIPVIPESKNQSKKHDSSWKELLRPKDYPLFNALREWRKARGKEAGMPSYIICTNRQLALVVNHRPTNLAQLGEIRGFGKAKLEKYGKEILDLVASVSTSTVESYA